jgi:hypothetical protein
MKSMLYAVALVVGTTSINSAWAVQEAHGGSWVRSEFYVKSEAILEYLKGNNIDHLDLVKFSDLIQSMDVEVTEDSLTYKGEPVDAINFFPGQKVIRINYQAWMDHFTLGRDVYPLVYHELLPYFGIDDSNHQDSAKLNLAPPAWGCAASCIGGPAQDTFVSGEGETALGAFMSMQNYCVDRLHGMYVWVNSPGDYATINNSCVKN